MYLDSHVSLNFYILSLFLVNDSQALQVNLGSFKWFLGMKLSPANTNMFIFYSHLPNIITDLFEIF